MIRQPAPPRPGGAPDTARRASPPGDRPHFGGFLREARESKQVALTQVSRLTKVPETALRLLEAGKLEELPPEVFVRGYIRSYARAIGVSDQEPVRLFDEMVRAREAERAAELAAPQPLATLAEIVSRPHDDDDQIVSRRGYGLAVFVVIVLLIATITLSYLLRQPPPSGEGLSLGKPAATGLDATPSDPVGNDLPRG